MVIRRPLPVVLALVLSVSAAVPALDLTPRDMARVPVVEFTELLAHPAAMSGREVRFQCTFAELTDLYDVLRSGFLPERYYSVAVWDDRARLWEPEARGNVVLGLYLHKDRFTPERIAALKKYDVLDMVAVIKEVIDGAPQLEVLEVAPIQGAGALSDQAVYLIERAQALLVDARDLAEANYAEALQLPLPVAQRIDVSVLRGRNLLAMGESAKAGEVFQQAVALLEQDKARAPADAAQVYCLLAKSLNEAKQFEASVAQAKAALALDPSLGEAYAVLGIGFAGLEHYDEARRSCDTAVRLRPADAEVRWYLGRILIQQKRYDDAIEALKKAIDLTPKDHRIHLSVADAYRCRGQVGGATAAQDVVTALREVDIALRLKSDQPDAVVLAGVILEDAARTSQEVVVAAGRVVATTAMAAERYQRALEMAPQHVGALTALGLLHAREHRAEQARAIAAQLTALHADAAAQSVLAAVDVAPAPAEAAAAAVAAPAAAVAPAASAPAEAVVEPAKTP